MRSNYLKATLKTAVLAVTVLLLGAGLAVSQTVNLIAAPTTVALPDGSVVPMWGYTCGTSAAVSTVTCAALNSSALIPAAWVASHAYSLNQLIVDSNGNVQKVTFAGTSGSTQPTWATSGTTTDAGVTWTFQATVSSFLATGPYWSPVVITVPYTGPATSLVISLSNNLQFSNGNSVPTSLVIVGQLGGGLGDKTQRTTTTSPDHSNAQQITWPIAVPGPANQPPIQPDRVQSFSTEVAAGATTSLTWSNLRPGTYLIESGTHPSIQGPMGLFGMLVVTAPPTSSPDTTTGVPTETAFGTAYPNVNYDAEIPLLLSEIDPVQNNAVNAAVNTMGFSETAVWARSGASVRSITVTNGGSGYTAPPTVTINGAGSGATASATLTSGVVTSITVNTSGDGYAPASSGNSSTTVTITPATGDTTGSGATAYATVILGSCGGNANTCYPPAVNYTPLYYAINGVAFNKNAPSTSLFPTLPNKIMATTTTGIPTGKVLVRLVNAGLRMHIPSIVGSQTGLPVSPATVPPSGFSLIAEDGNPLPGVPRVQSEVFMAAGKTYDVMINGPAAGSTALPIYDRQLSLSGNAIARDAGMLAYIGANGAGLPTSGAFTPAAVAANPDSYNLFAGQTLNISDLSKGVIANDVNVNGVRVFTAPTNGTLTLNSNGTFTYAANASWTGDSFVYAANGATACQTSGVGPCATVTLVNCATAANCQEANTGIVMNGHTFTSNVATHISIAPPGVLSFDTDTAGYPLTVYNPKTVTALTGPGTGTLSVDPNGGFNATVDTPGTYTFSYFAQNSQGTQSATSATVTLIFPAPSNLAVTVYDPVTKAPITDYRWVIEEDRTFYVDPNCTTNTATPPAGCPTGIVPTFGTNFHTSYMPVVATGCTGDLSCESGQSVLGQPAVCDVGNGVCRTDASEQTKVDPKQVSLDPTKRYYISVLPGDAANPFINAYGGAPACTKDPSTGNIDTTNGSCGHGMGGAPIPALCKLGTTNCTVTTHAPVQILTQPSPFPPSKLSVFVFEDDFPLNGEQDAGGGVDVLSPNEPGLGGFNITLFDDAGGSGDATGQMTYDMFNMPLSNSLAGTTDPATGLDACPIGASAAAEQTGSNGIQGTLGITGTIVTCPKYESDGVTLSPLAGQAVIANLMPGRYGVVATPAADRIARGEEWLQTNTLDGQKAHDSFLRIGEPSFFQEFGPAGYHVSIGFANPGIINARKDFVCNGTDPSSPKPGTVLSCNNSVTAVVTTERMSRTPDERLYSSGDNSSFAFTQCYVSFGDPDAEDFVFTRCDQNGKFTLSGLPDGDWRITIFDQWNDMLVDGLSTPVRLAGGKLLDMGQIAMNQWQSNIYTKTFFDLNGNGIQDSTEDGLTLVATNNRFRDGSYSNFNNTDLAGNAGFNEIFPLFSWYVIETDTTRYKSTGVHVVYDAGGPADGSPACGAAGVVPCGGYSTPMLANTFEQVPVATSPQNLRVPGAVYCGPTDADCATDNLSNHPTGGGPGGSTGRIDPPFWFGSEGWQGFSGENNIIEFGKKPYAAATSIAPAENGGIHGEVIYASTRPFDDPTLLIHTSWTPDVPGVTINLYQEVTAPDGSTGLKLIDHTVTSSWDDWAQGFRSDGVPNMNCPGQGRDTGTDADLFFFTLYNQPMWLDVYANAGTPAHTVPNNSQFKCFDGMHNWNQVQPAPYDGMYSFPSVTSFDPKTGKPTGTNCTACIKNPDSSDQYRVGTPMLPAGKYVVEMIVPPGYELVKEEDKNILIGDNYIAPVTQQFAGLGNIFILPDQAEINSLYNSNNAQNPTQTFGRTTLPSHEGDTGSVETFWPCVGASRVVPDYISLFPNSHEVSPFAGATRNLCDRKEVTVTDQSSSLAKFWIFTSAHVAAHFTGVITDDYTSEFDPFSPQFGEKFSPPNLPVSLKDWSGTEVSRVYADQWGTYNGLTYSTWEVNPPNPTGYAPTMMVVCMNDPGPIVDTRPGSTTAGQMITDPLFNPQYSQFCYEIPFMPGQTQYMDTPVVPTSAFAGAGYNNPDCSYPDATPAIATVVGNDAGIPGPWVSAAGPGHTVTITALGDQDVPNYGYAGPSATTAPFNQKTVTRHYGFGGTQGTGSVTIGGVPLTNVSWGDNTISGTVNLTGTDAKGNPVSVPQCAVQQQAQYGGSTAYCGQLLITANNGKQSIDAVTVTIGGKQPTVIAGTPTPLSPSGVGTIQQYIDAAKPGDMIIVPPGTYYEMLLMWKPIRLQGVGAATSIINANTQPAGKMDVWRLRVNCLFGLTPSGVPNNGDTSCGSSWFGFAPTAQNAQVDRLPTEATVGWDATLNGNLAELLQEPSLMGALEGAGITVLAKGVNFPATGDPFGGGGGEAAFPDGTALLTSDPTDPANGCPNGTIDKPLGFSSSFQCNPSSIDGLGITDSSQGGGGIFVHGWGHNLQIANNRVHSNAGTLSGGINVGQGEFPPNYIQGAATNLPPGSCLNDNTITNGVQLPYCLDLNVNVHNNAITSNSSTGDELFSASPAGAGGISFCTGADYYKFNYNWVCGNLSTGDGGGVGQLGFVYKGDIEHNTILFNQSTNPTIATNGGGVLVMGAPDVDPACGATTDQDCVSPLGSIAPSDGAGPGLVINANLIMGNSADSGSGGGIRLQGINGTDVLSFPTVPAQWYSVNLTNNIIANNVAGWDGAGISLLDALNVNIINNTVMSNDTTASSGILFDTIGAPLASSEGSNCKQTGPSGANTASCPQPSGLVSIQNSSILSANLPSTIVCPAGHGNGGSGTGGLRNGHCRLYSVPLIENDIFWQNRAFYIGVGSLGTGTLNQQHVVALYDAFTNNTRASSQPITGACNTDARYWDIGVRGDTGPGNHSGGTLSPIWSMLSSGNYSANNTTTTTNPLAISQYCNGSRIPPEAGGAGWQVPPGISDATVPNPIFNMTPTATVDEGNNWINISWGPLSLINPNDGTQLGNYALISGSPAIDRINCFGSLANGCVPGSLAAGTFATAAPLLDFFGNPRPDPVVTNRIDVGAVEYQGNTFVTQGPALTGIRPISGARGTIVGVVLTGTNLSTVNTVTVTPSNNIGVTLTSVNATTVTARFNIAAGAATGARTVTVTAPGFPASNGETFTVTGPQLTSIIPNSGMRGRAVPVTLTGSGLTGTTAINVSGTGVTVSNRTVVSDTTVTATFTIAPNATLSNRTVSVTTTPGVTSNTVTFTVTGPTLTSIAPSSGVINSSVSVTLTGVGLTGATAVTVSGANVTVTNFHAVSDTSVTATFNIAGGANLGARNVAVTTPIGTTGNVTFTVTGAVISFTGPAPALTTSPANTTTKTGTVTLSNGVAATGPLTLTAVPAVVKVGTAGGTFSITGGTCASGSVIAPGGSCTVTVQYAPGTSTATATAHVTITGSGINPNPLNSGNFNGN